MRYLESAGLVAFLIGCGGLSESYDSFKAMIISLVIIAIGLVMIRLGIKDETTGNDNCNSNVLDRLYFLR